MPDYARRPEWLRLVPLDPAVLAPMRELTRHLKLHTVAKVLAAPTAQGALLKAQQPS